MNNFKIYIRFIQGLGWHSGEGAALLVGRSWDRFLVVSLDFSVTYSFRPFHGPGVDSAPSENEYQEHLLGVKAAGVWGWQPHHFHVLNVMKSWSLNLLEPSVPHRACYRTFIPFFYLYMVHTHTTFCTVIIIRTNHSYSPHQSSKQLLCYFLVNMIVVLAVW